MRLLAPILLALLAACGQSGALYLPDEPAPAAAENGAPDAEDEAQPGSARREAR